MTAAVHLIAIFGKYIEPEKPIVYVEPADGLRFRLRNKERDTYYMVEDAPNYLVIAEDRYAEGSTFTLEKADASSYYIKTASGRYVYQASSGSQANKTTSATKVKYTITASGEHLYNFGQPAQLTPTDFCMLLQTISTSVDGPKTWNAHNGICRKTIQQ